MSNFTEITRKILYIKERKLELQEANARARAKGLEVIEKKAAANSWTREK
jgi:hypothetical protein